MSTFGMHAGKKQRIVEPIGVTVVEEDEEPVGHAPEMQRLLRQPRCANMLCTCLSIAQTSLLAALSLATAENGT